MAFLFLAFFTADFLIDKVTFTRWAPSVRHVRLSPFFFMEGKYTYTSRISQAPYNFSKALTKQMMEKNPGTMADAAWIMGAGNH